MRDRNPVIDVHLSRRTLLTALPAVAGAVFGVSSEMVSDRVDAQVKLSHKLSLYQDMPKNGQQCSTCVQFQPPMSCKIVVDPISPKGWCQFYVKKG